MAGTRSVDDDAAELARLVDEFEAITHRLRTCYQSLRTLQFRGNIAPNALAFRSSPGCWPRLNRDEVDPGYPRYPRSSYGILIQNGCGWYFERPG